METGSRPGRVQKWAWEVADREDRLAVWKLLVLLLLLLAHSHHLQLQTVKTA